MMKNFEDAQKLGKNGVDATLQSFSATSKSFQAIAVEIADYSKRSFEQGVAAVEKLFGAKSFDKVIEAQNDYVKTAYEGFVAEATRLGELYADLTKDACKPFESYLGRSTTDK